MRNFTYVRARTPEEASKVLLDGHGSLQVLAGGTDLIPLAKEEIAQPDGLVDISGWREGRGITREDSSVVIGALTPLSAIAADETIKANYRALAEACSLAATPQLRNMGTIGGNLLQQTRCWYYRGPFDCWLKGGETCNARAGENENHAIFDTQASPCVSAHPSDPAAALLAFDAGIRYQSSDGVKEITLKEMYHLPDESRRSMISLPDDAIITAILLRAVSPGTRSTYVKAMARAAWGFSLAGVALVVEGEPITDAKVALSGVSPIPKRADWLEEEMRGKGRKDLDISTLMDLLVKGAEPLSQNGYKVELLRGVFAEAWEGVWQNS